MKTDQLAPCYIGYITRPHDLEIKMMLSTFTLLHLGFEALKQTTAKLWFLEIG